MSLDQDRISTMNILRSNTNVNIFKPYSASPLVFSPKTKSTVNKIKNAVYRLNPQVAYLGKRSDRAKLILQIQNEPF